MVFVFAWLVLIAICGLVTSDHWVKVSMHICRWPASILRKIVAVFPLVAWSTKTWGFLRVHGPRLILAILWELLLLWRCHNVFSYLFKEQCVQVLVHVLSTALNKFTVRFGDEILRWKMLHLLMILICVPFYGSDDDRALMFDICWWSRLVDISLWSIEIVTFITCQVALSWAASQIRFLPASQWFIRLVFEVLLIHWSFIECFLVCLIFFMCHTLSVLRLATTFPVLLALQG